MTRKKVLMIVVLLDSVDLSFAGGNRAKYGTLRSLWKTPRAMIIGKR